MSWFSVQIRAERSKFDAIPLFLRYEMFIRAQDFEFPTKVFKVYLLVCYEVPFYVHNKIITDGKTCLHATRLAKSLAIFTERSVNPLDQRAFTNWHGARGRLATR